MLVYEVGIVICSITPLPHYRLVDEQDRRMILRLDPSTYFGPTFLIRVWYAFIVLTVPSIHKDVMMRPKIPERKQKLRAHILLQ